MPDCPQPECSPITVAGGPSGKVEQARFLGWKRNVAVLWVAQTMTMVAFSFVYPFIPLYVKTMGVTGDADAARWSGLIGLAAAVSMGAAQPVWGSVADRFGRRPMVIRSMLGSAVFILLMGVATSPGQLVVIRFLQGLVSGTVAASTALVATATPKEKTGFALGALQMGFFVGNSIGPLLGGLVADALGFRATCFIAGAMQVAGALLVLSFVKEEFTRPEAGTARPNILESSRALLAIGIFPILLGVIFMATYGGSVVAPFLTLFVEQLHGSGNAATVAGAVFGAMGLVSAVAALGLGKVGDRFGHDVLLPVCVIGAALTCFPQAWVETLGQFVALRMVLGVFLGGLMPSANALVAVVVPHEQRGAAFGLTAAVQCLANAVGPLSAIGIVTVLDMRTTFTISALLYAAAYLWVLVGFRRNRVGRFRTKAPAIAADGRLAAAAPEGIRAMQQEGRLAQPARLSDSVEAIGHDVGSYPEEVQPELGRYSLNGSPHGPFRRRISSGETWKLSRNRR